MSFAEAVMSSLPFCSGSRVDDHDLRRGVAICDEIAFETMLRRHSDGPLRVARAMLKDGAADADEVLLTRANHLRKGCPAAHRLI